MKRVMYGPKLAGVSPSPAHRSLILYAIMKPLLTSTETGSLEYLQFNLPIINGYLELVLILAGTHV
jgi:hypothetical protein